MSGTNQNIVPNIVFNEIPTPYYRPADLIEVRPTFGNVGILPFPARNLIIGGMLSTGTATAGVIQQNIILPAQLTALFGAGSQAEAMGIAFLATAGINIPLDVIGVSDAGGGAKAVYTVTFGGTWTGNGTTALAVAGVRYATGTLSTDTPTTTATEWAAQVNANPQAPVVATAATSVVTLTAKHAGLTGNDISIVVSPAQGDALVAGMTCVIAQTVQGATNPSIAAAITAINGLWYTDIAIAWQDIPNLTSLAAELARRYNAMVHLDARGWTFLTGTYSQQLAVPPSVNSQFIFAPGSTAPGSPPWTLTGSLMGVASQSLLQDPSLQLGDLALPGMVGPQRANLPNDAEQELMLAGKVSTLNVLRDGTVTIQRVVSTYETNSAGVTDITTWFDIMETSVATAIRYDWKQYLKSTYPQNKLAPDGSIAAERNTNVLTPSKAKGSWAARMLVYAQAGWIDNETADAKAAMFKIDPTDRNRLDYQVQYTRIGNKMVTAGVLMFQAT